MARRSPVAGVFALAALAVLAAPRPAGAQSAAAPSAAAPGRMVVSVLHTTDVHGHLLGWDYDAGKPADGYGLARVATLIRRVRAEAGARTILVDDGDCIQGAALSDVHDAQVAAATTKAARAKLAVDPVMACMNALGYDAMAVGNHEFSYGMGVFERARGEAKFPWLSANTVQAAGGDGPCASYLVKEIAGARIGFLGLTTPSVATYEDASHYAGLAFDDPLAAAQRWVPVLRDKEHCDAVVVLLHGGMEEDERGRAYPGQAPNENRALAIARGVPGIDAIVMGHTHVKVVSKTEHGVVLTEAGKWGEALGRLDLAFERTADGTGWKLADRKATLLTVDASVPEDSTIVALARAAHEAAERALSRVVATAARELSGADARLRDNALLDIVQATQLAAGKADVSFATMFTPRLTVAAGPIHVRDVWALYPYPNTLVVVQATGQDVKDALEHAAAYYPTYDFGRAPGAGGGAAAAPPIAGSNFDVAQGVRYWIDATRPVGQRVRDLTWRGAPLSPTATLRVAINNTRYNRSGGYDMWAGKKVVYRSDRPIRDLVVDRLARTKRVTGATDGHWHAAPAWALAEGAASPARLALELLVRQRVVPADSALAWGPDAPLTRQRYGAWLAAVGGEGARGLVDPTAPGQARDMHVPAAQVGGPVNADLARVAARYALPEPIKSRFMGMQAGAWDAVGAPLSVGEGARALAGVFFPRLVILEVTDFHGQLLPGPKDRATGRPVGGAGALAGLVEHERARDPLHTIVLDGGDWMQGTPLSNLNFGRPDIQLMNREGIDVSAVGNHEFDWTADTLFARFHEARFQPVAANWFDKATHRRAFIVPPYTVLSRDGMEIGVIGVMTTSTPTTTKPQNVTPWEFPDAGPTARALLDSVRAAGADFAVVVGHIPGTQDSTGEVKGELADLARAVGGPAGAVAVLGGHSHNRVSGLVDGTPVMIAGALGNTLGRMELVIDRRTSRPLPEETRRQLLTPFADDSATVDRGVTAWVDSINAGLAPIMGRVVGRVTSELTRNRQGESSLGDWVADAIRESAHTAIAFTNPGGLRADVSAGDITLGGIYGVIPFDNTIVTVTLTGAQVLDVLEQGVSPTTCIQLSGIAITYDPRKPRGQRIASATLPGGKPVDPAARYTVATNDFMAQGGDGFVTFAKGQGLVDTGVLVREALQQQLERLTAAGKPLAPATPGRIVNLATKP